ncbi:hypothetical protein [Paenibacillus lutimineralis]|uniref:hypothetical protein n=1 Tax=Paenibacillus lutimineralis TaxID=2707005 RepID=UPI0013A62349|nr:hypothetical protein [Paenibacillus lutimineralis]
MTASCRVYTRYKPSGRVIQCICVFMLPETGVPSSHCRSTAGCQTIPFALLAKRLFVSSLLVRKYSPPNSVSEASIPERLPCDPVFETVPLMLSYVSEVPSKEAVTTCSAPEPEIEWIGHSTLPVRSSMYG